MGYVWAIASLVVSVISSVYSYQTQKRAAAKARAAQEAAKEAARGLAIAVEGQILNLPIAYGRAKVAGARVFHEVTNSFYGADGRSTGAWVFGSDGVIVGNQHATVTCVNISVGVYKVMVRERTYNAYTNSYDVGGWVQDKNVDGSLKYTLEAPIVDPLFHLSSDQYSVYSLADDAYTYTAALSNITLSYVSNAYSLTVATGLANIIIVGATVTLSHNPWFTTIQGEVVTENSNFIYTVVSYNATTGLLTLSGANLTSMAKSSHGYEATGLIHGTDMSPLADKHQALWWQQAICVGGINKVLHIEYDNEDYRLAKFLTRVNVRTNGGIDQWFLATFPWLTENKFPDTCYATAMAWCNRDDPQFGAVPNTVFHVEGMKVYDIVDTAGVYSLSATKIYSNNPVLCLLDYLLSSNYGKGLALSEIDLGTFYKAKRICNRKVPISGSFTPPAGGNVWVEKVKSGDAHYVNLYECNLLIDTKKTVRENIEQIIDTMEEADLIWSDGLYRLILNYPEKYVTTFDATTIGRMDGTFPVKGASYYGIDEVVQYTHSGSTDLYVSTIANNILPPLNGGGTLNPNWKKGPGAGLVCAYITDDHISEDGEISQTWPNTQERYNYCTIRFLNEAKNFNEDTVSWPNKYPIALVTGLGNVTYTPISGWPVNAAGNFLNAYGVWNSGSTMTWKVFARESGDYTLEFAADDLGTITFGAHTLNSSYTTLTVSEKKVTLVKDVIYDVTITASNPGGGLAGVSASLTSPGGSIVWTTRGVSYTSMSVSYTDTSVYDAYLAEDNGVFLETEVFQSGDTSMYHAMATAEAKVRLSRSATQYSFAVTREMFMLEPGDIVSLSSDYLKIPGELLKIIGTKVTEKGDIQLNCRKFDANNLAWNAKDDEIVTQRNVYKRYVAAASALTFTPSASFEDFAGTLNWTASKDTSIEKYIVYCTTVPYGAIDENTEWRTLGETSTTTFILPMLYRKTYTFMVRSSDTNGQLSRLIDSFSNRLISPMVVGTVENTTTLPSPNNSTIYCSADELGNITRIKALVNFGEIEPIPVDGLCVFISQFPHPNSCTIAAGNTSTQLEVSEAQILERGTATILAGSNANKLEFKTGVGADVFDISYNECSRWWAQIAGSEWCKVTGITATAVLFDRGFADASDVVVNPVIGATCEYAELAWFDERQGEYRLAWLTNGSQHECIRWSKVEQASPVSPFYITCERGAEGTSVINANGGTFMYFPAPGAGSQTIIFPASAFTLEDGNLVATCEVNVSITAGYSISLSAAVATQLKDGTILRSAIVPCKYGGPI